MYRIGFVAASLLSFAAAAQPASPEHVRGQIVSVEGNTLTVKSKNGKTVKLNLADDVKVAVAEKGDMSDVKDGAFIGTTAVPGKNGTLRAIEVHVFPDSMRGTGEGHRPWDLRPGSTMTNATVSKADESGGGKSGSTMTNATVSKVAGRKLSLKYKDGEKTVEVPANAKVVKLAPGDKSELKKGAHVFIIASKQSDGSLRAERMTVGKDGLVPPM
ncbi:MAG: hypothetical protein ACM3PC_10810 [Deltaproteobacteria bacterium]